MRLDHLQTKAAARFKFISQALRGDGPFRPIVSVDSTDTAYVSGDSALVSYPRESADKFARRNAIAFYASPLARACSRFAGYLAMKEVSRDLMQDLYSVIADNVDGRGNEIDVFWGTWVVEAKARGSMLLLVDMPTSGASSLADQINARKVPYWSMIFPESVTDYQVGDDGKFDFVAFEGNFSAEDKRIQCIWRFDRTGWEARDKDKKLLAEGEHGLGECPILIFTESGEFPNFGPFAAIADLAKRLFNLDSELDEILRAQTFSLLTMQVPDESTDAQKLAAAKVAGETIGTSNLIVHSGNTPSFIAPPDGPARIYIDRINQIQDQIDEIGLIPQGSRQQESGIALQMRFQAINAELSRFAARMEDFERRAWDITRRWLGLTQEPDIQWPRDFNIADVETELKILADMQAANMPKQVIAEQQRKIVSVQFGALDQDRQQEIMQAIDEIEQEPPMSENVIPMRPDPNEPLRQAVVKALNGP